jgi:hypothetical protein
MSYKFRYYKFRSSLAFPNPKTSSLFNTTSSKDVYVELSSPSGYLQGGEF